MPKNTVVMTVSICLRDAMGAVLSWFTLHLSALVLGTADALKRWRVSKSLFNSLLVCSVSAQVLVETITQLNIMS